MSLLLSMVYLYAVCFNIFAGITGMAQSSSISSGPPPRYGMRTRLFLTTSLFLGIAAGIQTPVHAAESREKTVRSMTGEDALSLPGATSRQDRDRVDLQANQLTYLETEQKLIAEGNVEIIRGKQILTAERVEYDLSTDVAKAYGNVTLLQENGDIHFVDELEFKNELKEGVVTSLYSYIGQDGRLTADTGEQVENGDRIVLRNASYTPCIPCVKRDDVPIQDQLKTKETPAWSIDADKVIHDKKKKSVIYKNAKFRFQGVPVLYTPYFSHPDGSIKQKSGFLMPFFGFDSELGPNITSRYYWAIDDDKDATFGTLLSTNEAPLALAEYRQRFNNAYIEVSGSATRSDRVDLIGGNEVPKDNSFRGHLFAQGRWDINPKWRAGFDLQRTTDDQFLRAYNISNEDILETEFYTERFEERTYFTARGYGFQDTRVTSEDVDQPNIIPDVLYSRVGRPGSVLGGRLNFDASITGLRREGEGQDVTRSILETGWRKKTVFPLGLVSDTKLLLRGDFYNARDTDRADNVPNVSDTENSVRGFTQLHNVFRYPFIKAMEKASVVLEPVVALTISPDVDQKENEIPNEDSQDVQLDIASLFNEMRFPGKDRLEDTSRVTYGLNSGYYMSDGSFARVFLGQSYKFDDDNALFPDGSGLAEQDSDIVGRIGIQYKNNFDLDYSFQLANDSLMSERHELTSRIALSRFGVNTRYFFSRGLEDTSVREKREQVRVGSYLWLDQDKQWRARGGFTHDFSVTDGLRRAYGGLDFYNECRCWNMSLTAVRNLTSRTSGESSTEFLVQIGFKNLGSFGNANLSSP